MIRKNITTTATVIRAPIKIFFISFFLLLIICRVHLRGLCDDITSPGRKITRHSAGKGQKMPRTCLVLWQKSFIFRLFSHFHLLCQISGIYDKILLFARDQTYYGRDLWIP